MTAPLCTLCDRWKCFYDTYGKNNLKGVGNENADIMLVGECYSDDTEVLTREGWKLFKDITYQDKFYSINPQTKLIELASPINIIKKEYCGEMYHYKTPSVDLLVTPNHLLYAASSISKNFKLISLDNLKSKTFTMTSIGISTNVLARNKHFMELFGFWLGDGGKAICQRKHGTIYRIIFKLKKLRKITYLRNLLKKLNISFIERGDTNNNKTKNFVTFEINNNHTLYKLLPDPKERRLPSWVFTLDKESLLHLLTGMLYSDGTMRTQHIYSSRKGLIDDLQQVCFICGIPATLSTRSRQEQVGREITKGYKIKTIKPSYTLILRKRISNFTLTKDTIKKIDYKGFVYDVTLEKNHTLVVRRNGRMIISSNCPGENEANTGIPFVGASGKMLNEMLLYAGVQREDVFITNALRCWHPDNKTPSVREIKNCRPYLLNEINTVKPKIIIAIGRIPMTALGIKEDQSAAVGKLHKSPYTTVPVFAIYHPAYILRNRKLKDTNFEYFKKGVESIGKKIINGLVTDNYYVVRTVCQAKKARDFLLGRKFISYDAEASGLDYFNTKNPVYLKSVAFGFNQGKAVVFPTTPDVFPKEEDRKEVIQYIKEILESDVLKTAHNAKWDNGLFLVMGIKVKNLYIDTILAAHQLDENAAKDLDSCVLRYVPEMAGYSNVIKEKYKGKPHKAHGEDLWFYNAGDADATLRLAKLFYKKLREDNMWWLHKNVLVPATECFIRMENHGVKCDRDLMKELEKKYIEDHKRISKEIKEIPEVIQFEQLTGQYYNSASPSHNKKMFIEIYKLPVIKESEITKQPSIDKDVLTVYAEKHNNELARKVRELSLIEKVLSTYLTGFYKYLYKDDIAHTQINLDVTVTGRTSSGGGGKTKEDEMESFKIVDVDAAQRKAPNLQNIPKRNLALRNIIKARDNRYLIGQDFAQSEVGCVAAISKDQKLIKAYMEGTDLHSQIAATIFGVKLEEVTKEQRNNAKVTTFGLLYGISPKGLARRTGWTEEQASNMINKYFETFPQLDRYMKDVVRQVDIRQWVESPLHRRRRFPLVDNRAYRQAMNQPTQSLSSDLLIYGLVILDKLIEEQDLYEHITPILAVHDEICVEAETGYVVKAIELIKQAFTKDLYKNKFIAEVMGKIRLGIDMKISPCGGGWGAYLPLSTYDDTILNRIDKGELVIDLDLKLKETDLTTPKKRAIG